MEYTEGQEFIFFVTRKVFAYFTLLVQSGEKEGELILRADTHYSEKRFNQEEYEQYRELRKIPITDFEGRLAFARNNPLFREVAKEDFYTERNKVDEKPDAGWLQR